MKLFELRSKATEALDEAGIERARYAADLIISKVLSLTRIELVTRENENIERPMYDEVFAMVEKRLKRVPLSYILGESEFYGYKFEVGQGCLIPRPETELLVENMLTLVKFGTFADWCTGSGCIGITMLLENADYRGYGVDSSPEALCWAEKNRELHGMNDRFTLIRCSEPKEAGIEHGSLDFVIANPPYIPSREIDSLMADVRDNEPKEALDGGVDGLDVFIKIIDAAPALIKKGGYLGFETAGDSQAEHLLKIVPECFVLTNKIYDYNGILRHIIWQIS